jgi:uncharacterized protein (TIGR00297 family)
MEASSSDWIHSLVGLVGLTGVVATGEGARKIFGWPGETTRKLIHIGTGLIVFPAPLYISTHVPLAVLGIVFAIVNFFAVRFSWFPGMHATRRKTYGTVYYPLAITGLAWLFWEAHPEIFMTSVLVLSLADPLAAWAGERSKTPIRFNWCGDPKTVQGSITMGVVTAGIVLAGSFVLSGGGGFSLQAWMNAVLAGWIAAIAEAMSSRGSDNLSIPAAVSAFLFFTQSVPPDGMTQIHSGFVLAAGVAWAAYRLNALTGGGAVAATLVGGLIFGLGGWSMALPLMTFFVTSSLLSKWGRRRPSIEEDCVQKTDRRDAIQVMANGGVACVIAILAYMSDDRRWLPVFAAAVAAANADTWATEIGTRFGKRPIDILRWTKVETGMSGGVTWIGSLAAAAGGWIIAAMVFVTGPDVPLTSMLSITCAALAASFVDSLLGSGLQGRFECTVCQQPTEKTSHCGRTTVHRRGWKWLNNDGVNAVAIAAGTWFMWIAEF